MVNKKTESSDDRKKCFNIYLWNMAYGLLMAIAAGACVYGYNLLKTKEDQEIIYYGMIALGGIVCLFAMYKLFKNYQQLYINCPNLFYADMIVNVLF